MLGIMSTIGLGSGAHTFVLFLAPFIAETATTAFVCNSLNFDTRGPNGFCLLNYMLALRAGAMRSPDLSFRSLKLLKR